MNYDEMLKMAQYEIFLIGVVESLKNAKSEITPLLIKDEHLDSIDEEFILYVVSDDIGIELNIQGTYNADEIDSETNYNESYLTGITYELFISNNNDEKVKLSLPLHLHNSLNKILDI